MEPEPMKELDCESTLAKEERQRAVSRKSSRKYIKNNPEWHKQNKREWARKSRETEEGKAAAVQCTLTSRSKHREEYNAYMKEYQRKKRAEAKAAKLAENEKKSEK